MYTWVRRPSAEDQAAGTLHYRVCSLVEQAGHQAYHAGIAKSQRAHAEGKGSMGKRIVVGETRGDVPQGTCMQL